MTWVDFERERGSVEKHTLPKDLLYLYTDVSKISGKMLSIM